MQPWGDGRSHRRDADAGRQARSLVDRLVRGRVRGWYGNALARHREDYRGGNPAPAGATVGGAGAGGGGGHAREQGGLVPPDVGLAGIHGGVPPHGDRRDGGRGRRFGLERAMEKPTAEMIAVFATVSRGGPGSAGTEDVRPPGG